MRNLFKYIFGVSLLVFLVGCGEDKGSGPDSGSSSSSLIPMSSHVVDPNSAVIIQNFNASLGSGDILSLSGSVSIDFEAQYTEEDIYLDSVTFTVATIDGYMVPGAEIITVPFDFTGEEGVDIGLDLQAKLNLRSFEGCGNFKVFVFGYANGKMNNASVQFTKDKDYYCPEVIPSSSSAEEPQVMMKRFGVQLSTNPMAKIAIDLDSKQLFSISEAPANAETIDLTLRRQGSEAFFTLGSGVQMAEEMSGKYDVVNYPEELTPFSSFFFRESDFTATMEEGMINGIMYIIKTPQFNNETKAGIFAVLVLRREMIGSNQTDVELLVWGKE